VLVEEPPPPSGGGLCWERGCGRTGPSGEVSRVGVESWWDVSGHIGGGREREEEGVDLGEMETVCMGLFISSFRPKP